MLFELFYYRPDLGEKRQHKQRIYIRVPEGSCMPLVPSELRGWTQEICEALEYRHHEWDWIPEEPLELAVSTNGAYFITLRIQRHMRYTLIGNDYDN